MYDMDVDLDVDYRYDIEIHNRYLVRNDLELILAGNAHKKIECQVLTTQFMRARTVTW
jgi:hypothetical protein